MRKIIAAAFVSLDGVMQAPGGPQEDPSGGFAYGGWMVPYADDELGEGMTSLFGAPFDLLLGRRTYDIFAAFWPNQPADHPIAEPFNRVTKYVATHRPDSLAWNNSQALGPDIVARVRELKAGDGPKIITQGSASLVQTLLAAGLVDKLKLLTFPIVLGRGIRLFGADALPAAFRLESSKVSAGGAIVATYVRAGEVRTGEFPSA